MKKTITFFLVGFIGFLVLWSVIISLNMKKIEVGDRIPKFSLKDQNGTIFKVENALGKPMVIYFYPKDDTPGCTREACKFRDEFENFTDLGALVIGISADNVASHKKFEEKYSLPFILLSDEDNAVRKQFGVPKNLFLIPGRVTYVIDKKGIIRYLFNSQLGAEKHIEHALEELKKI